jgi:hypothetical protein
MPTRKWDFETTIQIPLEVVLRVRGTHTDAKINADPDDCHDVEHDEEREILDVLIEDDLLPKEVVKALEPYLQDAVYDAEVVAD